MPSPSQRFVFVAVLAAVGLVIGSARREAMTSVIRTTSRRLRNSYVYTHQVIDVPATELTFSANCESISAEFSDLDAAAVSEACRRLLRTSDGGVLA